MKKPARREIRLLKLMGLGLLSISLCIANAGPGVSGGGDIPKDLPPTLEEIELGIPKARLVLPFVINAIENAVVHRKAGNKNPVHPSAQYVFDIDRSIIKAMFPWPQVRGDIHQRLARIKLKISPLAPCLDGFGMPKAASAFPLDGDEVCLSLKVIQSQVTQANLVRRLTALLGHELLHKMGVEDEGLTEKFEDLIYRGIPDDPSLIILEEFENPAKTKRQEEALDFIFQSTTLLLKRLQRGSIQVSDWLAICTEIGELAGLTRSIAEGFQMHPFLLQVNRPNSLAKARILSLSGSLIKGYCVPLNVPNDLRRLKLQDSIDLSRHPDPLMSMSMLKQKVTLPEIQNQTLLIRSLKEMHYNADQLRKMFLMARRDLLTPHLKKP